MAKIYGPYKRKDGRKHIILVYHNKDGSIKRRTTVSYPKYLAEKRLGRKLKENETVDHIDGNFENDDLNNLRVVPRIKHSKEDVLRAKKKKIVCVWCGSRTYKRRSYLRGNSKKNRAGPFCSKRCSGKYGAYVQNGGSSFSVQPFPKLKYYKMKKTGGIKL